MSDFRNFLNKQLEDPEFKAEWEALQPELSLVQAMIDARKVSGLTQKELSERTGIAQADISKLENGNATLVFEHADVAEMCRRYGNAGQN